MWTGWPVTEKPPGWGEPSRIGVAIIVTFAVLASLFVVALFGG